METIPEIKSPELRPVIVNQKPAKKPMYSVGLYSIAGAQLSESFEGVPTEAGAPEAVRPFVPENVE